MVPAPIFLTLRNKKQLTHDVYELGYESEQVMTILPGQYLLCDTSWDPKLRRSYSVSWVEGKSIFFIIKRVPEGTGGSVAICDQEIGHRMQVWWPMGRFVLRDTLYPKVFIGTGTGFAPLYFMMKSLLNQKMTNDGLFFLFWVRELSDTYYVDQLQQWSENSWFDYEIYCSREPSILPEKHHEWRITEYLIPERLSELNTTGETEFYICGSPAMVTEVRSMLQLYGISQEKVFFEQY